MPSIHSETGADLDAPPGAVYAVLADYRQGHREILPQRYFSKLEIERGGNGAGTVIRLELSAAGTRRPVRAEITEPEPGRVLVETDLDTGAVTRFTVDPVPDGGGTRVRVHTQWSTRGLRGWAERLLGPVILRRIHAATLHNLREVLGGGATVTPGSMAAAESTAALSPNAGSPSE